MKIKSLLLGEITENDLLSYYNASITNMRLPRYINGFVFSYRDINNIIINTNLSEEKQKEARIHELAHIELNHLNRINEFLEFSFIKYEDEVDEYIDDLLKGEYK